MKFLTSLTLCYLIISTQSQFQQNQYYPQYQNQDNIYFPDTATTLRQGVQPNKELLQQIFGQPTKSKTGVEIEKSNEISVSTTVEYVTDRGTKAELSTKRPAAQVGHAAQVAQVVPIGQTTQAGQLLPVGQTSPIGHIGQIPQRGQAAVVSAQSVLPTVPNQSGYNGLLYSVTSFGINLLRNINTVKAGNVVFSPYSITSLLALLQQGSTGQTREQLTAALQMSPAASADAYSQISEEYKNRNSRNVLRTANNIFVGDNFVINSDFKKVAHRNFDSDITPVSFNRRDQAAKQINSWVASRTNNKIDRLVSPDAIDSTTQLVLVNAVYFKGLWEVPFRVESTLPREFQLSNGQTKITPFMRTRRAIKAGVDPTTNARVVLLPFERNQYSLMVILPSTLEGVTGTLRSLTDARLLSYLSFSLEDIELELPKFTVKVDTDLAQVLRDMGLTRMFGPYAELEGLGTYRAFSPEISSAVHSAVLSIDEQGGSAAAATSFAAVALSYDVGPILIRVNRPFIAVLWDTATSLPLFMAKIEDPQ